MFFATSDRESVIAENSPGAIAEEQEALLRRM